MKLIQVVAIFYTFNLLIEPLRANNNRGLRIVIPSSEGTNSAKQRRVLKGKGSGGEKDSNAVKSKASETNIKIKVDDKIAHIKTKETKKSDKKESLNDPTHSKDKEVESPEKKIESPEKKIESPEKKIESPEKPVAKVEAQKKDKFALDEEITKSDKIKPEIEPLKTTISPTIIVTAPETAKVTEKETIPPTEVEVEDIFTFTTTKQPKKIKKDKEEETEEISTSQCKTGKEIGEKLIGKDCLSASNTSGCSNELCETEVCVTFGDSLCCDHQWDINCAEEAKMFCFRNKLAGNDCFSFSGFDTGCSDKVCESKVCEMNSLCCSSSWTWDCALTAFDVCCIESGE